jgi:hypothetical protein
MEIQKQIENPLIKNLQAAITQNTTKPDISRVDKVEMNIELRRYKTHSGAVNFPQLFKIPVENRLAAMAERDFASTMGIITVALTLCFESMNLARPMQNFQILDLAEAIVDSSQEEDRLSLEDLMLFIQKLTRGDYGPLYESIDIPKFMNILSKYRDERWQEGIKLRDEKANYYKELGGDNSFDRKYKKPETPFDEYLQRYNTKLQTVKDELKEERRINREKQ